MLVRVGGRRKEVDRGRRARPEEVVVVELDRLVGLSTELTIDGRDGVGRGRGTCVGVRQNSARRAKEGKERRRKASGLCNVTGESYFIFFGPMELLLPTLVQLRSSRTVCALISVVDRANWRGGARFERRLPGLEVRPERKRGALRGSGVILFFFFFLSCVP